MAIDVWALLRSWILFAARLSAGTAKSDVNEYTLALSGGRDNGGGNANSWGLDEIEVYTGVAPAAISEPSTFALAALGLLSLGLFGWRRRRR